MINRDRLETRLTRKLHPMLGYKVTVGQATEVPPRTSRHHDLVMKASEQLGALWEPFKRAD